jgi:hypothetical protein
LGVEALLAKLAELARKKATILCVEGVDFCLFLLLTPVLIRRPLMFKEKKRTTLLFWSKRERPILLFFIHQIQNQKPISFHSFSTNAKETKEERDPFFFLFICRKQREKET